MAFVRYLAIANKDECARPDTRDKLRSDRRDEAVSKLDEERNDDAA